MNTEDVTKTAGKDAAQQRAEYVAALKAEREGYARTGKTDRAKQVDAELARFNEAPKARKRTESSKA